MEDVVRELWMVASVAVQTKTLRHLPVTDKVSTDLPFVVCADFEAIYSLKEGELVNDVAINAFVGLFNKEHDDMFMFYTHFYSSGERGSISSGYDISGIVARFVGNVNLRKFKKLYVPIHVGSHWALGVIDFSNQKVIVYDSGNGYDVGVFKDKMDTFLGAYNTFLGKSVDDIATFGCVSSGVKQEDATSCGAFLMAHAIFSANNWPFSFTGRDSCRLREYAAYYIGTNKNAWKELQTNNVTIAESVFVKPVVRTKRPKYNLVVSKIPEKDVLWWEK